MKTPYRAESEGEAREDLPDKDTREVYGRSGLTHPTKSMSVSYCSDLILEGERGFLQLCRCESPK